MKPLLSLCIAAALVGALAGWGAGWHRAAAEHRARVEKENADALAVAKIPAALLADLTHEADVVVLVFDPRTGSEATFSDKLWLERLADILRSGVYTPRPHCMCVSYPEIRLYRGGKIIATFSVHHGVALRAYASVVSGDFVVGADIGKAILDLANEKRDLAKLRL